MAPWELRRPKRVSVASFAVLAALTVVGTTVSTVLFADGPVTTFPFASLSSRSSTAPSASAPSGSATSPHASSSSYLALAEAGVEQTAKWWNASTGWYDADLPTGAHPTAVSLWESNGLFEALDEIAIADPSPRTKKAVETFANDELRYWNPNLKSVPGYSPLVNERRPTQPTWYDDNAWIGIAFLDAYRATGNRAYVTDATRAFAFIAAGGWDVGNGGGMWWSTEHQWLSGEALAASTDLAAGLYAITHEAKYLAAATTYITWANTHLLTAEGVYDPVSDLPYPYLIEPDSYVNRSQGAVGGVHICLKDSASCHAGDTVVAPCKAGDERCPSGSLVIVSCGSSATGCQPGNVLAPAAGSSGQCASEDHRCTTHPITSRRASMSANPTGASATSTTKSGTAPKQDAMPHDGEGALIAAMTTLCQATGEPAWCEEADQRARASIVYLAPFADGPQYDSVLVRGMLDLYTVNHDARLYDFAVKLAGLITEHAQTSANVYLHGWDGRAVPSSSGTSLRSDGGSISVFAAIATVAPPPRQAMLAANGAVSGRIPDSPA